MIAGRAAPTSGGVFVALVTTFGILTGARSIAHFETPRPASLLEPVLLSRQGIGIAWSDLALWPADIQQAAMERVIAVVTGLFAAAALLALLNAVTLLVEAASSRRAELAVRSAVGASPRDLIAMLLRELRAVGTLAFSLGLFTGMLLGAVARRTWPGPTEPVAWLTASDLVTGLAVVVALAAGAYVRAGMVASRPARAAAVLRAGARTAVDPLEIFGRKLLTAGHASVAGALLVAAFALSGGDPLGPGSEPAGDAEVFMIDAEAPAVGAWRAALARLDEIPGLEAESLSTPGALSGLGVRDLATAECGRCSRGGMPAPLWTVVADHHAVTPGFFGLAGVDVVEGRDFDDAAVDDEPVVLVNQTFARTAFERGRPIGKRVRVGTGLGSWYRVIGVVADVHVPVLGADELGRSVVYLDARLHEPRGGSVVLRGTEDAAEAASDLLVDFGFTAGPAHDADAYLSAAKAPLRWSERLTWIIGLLGLATAIHGVYLAALQTTRRRGREIAVRRALGAGAARIALHVLGDRLRVVSWGLGGFVFLGTLVIGLLRSAVGVPVPGPATYLAIAVGLGVVSLVASSRAAREAILVEPGVLLD